jgi:Protein of unknown function (DUF2934)
MTAPSEQQIKIRAHELWEQAGKPEGRDQEFWTKAEDALRETEQLRDIATAPPPKMLP